MGLVGPDEPRYASIGREMARSGDWITPRLWGLAWFEKPALLYWMTGIGFCLGLGLELAPRLPVALLSIAFVFFYFNTLKRHYGRSSAGHATLLLATSAGWLAYSRVAVFDLPLAATFSAAMLLALPWVESGDRRRLPAASAMLGLAVLAKGLVPLVLVLPLFWFGRRKFTDLLRPDVIAPFLAVALPWYLACWYYNGTAFLMTFFVEHHLGRFTSPALQHTQPVWYFVPVAAAAMFPWIAPMGLLFRPSLYVDSGRRFLLAWAAFGLVFFSLSANKLPGYLLPLLPAAAALAGIALAQRERAPWILSSVAAGMLLVGPLAAVLPQALAEGITRTALPQFQWWWLAPLPAAALVWQVESRGRRPQALGWLALILAGGVFWLTLSSVPTIDRSYSARPLWRQVAAAGGGVCAGEIHRAWRYGLNYYSVVPLPECGDGPGTGRQLRQIDRKVVLID